ncbi:acyltransferase [Agrococcus sp. Ld7]|uniref:acyltransferase n=1 Tax=Agrococcus sp. Ld7 TaxID=649148 RepID=UPI00386B9461
MSQEPVVQVSADVAASARLGARTRVWHLAQVREEAQLGSDCTVGRGAYVGPGVVMGNACKLQNYALVYEPARLGDGVFIGPGAVLTNDVFPRAANPDLSVKSAADWDAVGVSIGDGASIGARAVCIAPVVIGSWALVAAGAVVTEDVPDHALVVGTPARRIGWVGRRGKPLEPDGDRWVCPESGERYLQNGDGLALAD